MIEFYRFVDDFKGKEEYDYVITGMTGIGVYNYLNFHIWAGDNGWKMQFVKQENFHKIVKGKFKRSIEKVKKIHTEKWMRQYLVMHLFGKGSDEDYEKLRDFAQKHDMSVDNTNIE